MELKQLGLLTNSWSKVVSIQTQLLERISTIRWIEREFASPLNLPVFLWNSGARKFKQVDYYDGNCHLKPSVICNGFDLPGDDCLQILNFIIDYPRDAVFIIENLQSLMVISPTADISSRERAQKISSELVNIFYELKVSERKKYLLLLGTEEVDLPAHLAGLIPQVWKPLPTLQEINCFLEQFLSYEFGNVLGNADIDKLSIVASGLSLEEIRIGLHLGLSLTTGNNPLLPQFLVDYKRERFQGLGLDFVGEPNIPDFGGLDRLKLALALVKSDYSKEARACHIPLPKGWLLVGPPGTGKTLAAKVSARFLGFPLIGVDIGRVNSAGAAYLKRLIDRVEASAPVVVYFDEFDKLFTASNNTGEDSNSRALLGLLLTWLSEKQSMTFVIATLNRLQALPPELTRVGRFDEIFYVGFPQAIERQQIILLHASRFDERYKYGEGPLSEKEWKILLGKTVNYTGAELARIVEQAARKLFHEGKHIEIGFSELLEQQEVITPLYIRDPDRIIALENQARYVASPASSEDRSVYAPPLQSFWGDCT